MNVNVDGEACGSIFKDNENSNIKQK